MKLYCVKSDNAMDIIVRARNEKSALHKAEKTLGKPWGMPAPGLENPRVIDITGEGISSKKNGGTK